MTNFDRSLANHVATLLRDADLDLRPTVERRWMPKYLESDLTPPRICVGPRQQNRTTASRSAWRRTHIIQVGLWATVKHLPGGQVDDAKTDRMADLVESILDTICEAEPYEGASLSSAETDLLYDADMLKDSGIFRSLLSFTYTRVKR